MSQENLEQFMEQVAGSEELQARIGDEIDAESLIALGVECGFEFTAADLTTGAELSDGELDEVAGGFGIADLKNTSVQKLGSGRLGIRAGCGMNGIRLGTGMDGIRLGTGVDGIRANGGMDGFVFKVRM